MHAQAPCAIFFLLGHSGMENAVISERLCPVKPIRDSAPTASFGVWSHGHLIPSTFQNSRFPEGKQVSAINQSDCTNNFKEMIHRGWLGKVSCQCREWVAYQALRHWPRANLSAGPFKGRSYGHPLSYTLV
jgi:hypothetical protein